MYQNFEHIRIKTNLVNNFKYNIFDIFYLRIKQTNKKEMLLAVVLLALSNFDQARLETENYSKLCFSLCVLTLNSHI
jgi:hypothetical protein